MAKGKLRPTTNSGPVEKSSGKSDDSLVRRTRGRGHKEAVFPVGAPKAELPAGYFDTLSEIKDRIQRTRLKTVLAANSAMILLYWEIGQLVLVRQEKEGWGSKIIDRLSSDLRDVYPDMTGLSARNLNYMRAFAVAWPEREIVQRVVAQLPWRQNIALIQRLDSRETRLWYAEQAIKNGWSQSILTIQIDSRLHERQGMAVNNFDQSLSSDDSDTAIQVFKDPYLFDFLGTANLRREREVEKALVNHIQSFLLELGSGFAFVGRQVSLEVGDQDFLIDLLFYHLKLRCYVVIELKAVPFSPAFVGQLNLYLSAVDDLLKHPDDKPTIGLLLCREKNRLVVEYALRDLNKPIGVADWETKIVDALPDNLKGSLPTVAEIEAELGELETDEEND